MFTRIFCDIITEIFFINGLFYIYQTEIEEENDMSVIDIQKAFFDFFKTPDINQGVQEYKSNTRSSFIGCAYASGV